MVLVAYDISKNSTRNNLIKLLRGSGFYRIQKSVFIGEVSWKTSRIIINKIGLFIDPKKDIISCFHLNQDNFEESITLGKYKDDYFLDLEEFNIF
jgi:CRISPR-associated protein Cas2